MANKTPPITEESMIELLRLLEGYSKGNVSFSSPGGSSSTTAKTATAAQPAPTKAKDTKPSAATTPNRALNMAPAALSLAAMATQDKGLGSLATLAGLAKALSNPNASIQSVAPSFLGAMAKLTNTPALGQVAGVANMAFNGVSAPGILGLMSAVNPAFGMLGLVNSLFGNPIGASTTALSNTMSNPQSMSSLNALGVSNAEQAYNAANDWQGSMDTATMDSLMSALAADDSASFWGGRYDVGSTNNSTTGNTRGTANTGYGNADGYGGSDGGYGGGGGYGGYGGGGYDGRADD